MIKKMLLILVTLLVMGCTTPAEKWYAKGEVAYHQQNYHTAFAYILAAAKSNNPQAQYTAGYMYYYGLGTTRDQIAAVKWFKKAAYVGNIDAINALKLIRRNNHTDISRP